ncbi:hypothetical protein [Vibrio rarus]|nr:hypothetical protein [Vibrio rarus]
MHKTKLTIAAYVIATFLVIERVGDKGIDNICYVGEFCSQYYN